MSGVICGSLAGHFGGLAAIRLSALAAATFAIALPFLPLDDWAARD